MASLKGQLLQETFTVPPPPQNIHTRTHTQAFFSLTSRCPRHALTWVIPRTRGSPGLAGSGCQQSSCPLKRTDAPQMVTAPGSESDTKSTDGKRPFVNHITGETREESPPLQETLGRNDDHLPGRQNTKQGQKLEVLFRPIFEEKL